MCQRAGDEKARLSPVYFSPVYFDLIKLLCFQEAGGNRVKQVRTGLQNEPWGFCSLQGSGTECAQRHLWKVVSTLEQAQKRECVASHEIAQWFWISVLNNLCSGDIKWFGLSAVYLCAQFSDPHVPHRVSVFFQNTASLQRSRKNHVSQKSQRGSRPAAEPKIDRQGGN